MTNEPLDQLAKGLAKFHSLVPAILTNKEVDYTTKTGAKL